MGEIFNGPLGGCDWLVEERGAINPTYAFLSFDSVSVLRSREAETVRREF